MAALTVGLTGGLASGKSTLGRWLAEAGFEVVDADAIVAQLYRPGAAGARAVEELFGSTVLDAAGAVNHTALADRVFEPAVSSPSWRFVAPFFGDGAGSGIGLLFAIAGTATLILTLAVYAAPKLRRLEASLPDYAGLTADPTEAEDPGSETL